MISPFALGSLKTKTEKLDTALFYNFSNSLLKFPVSLIQLSKFDEEGNIWFEIKKPYKTIAGMDYMFPAELHFYKKNYPYYANLFGIATIAADDSKEMVTIKFRISKAECFYRKLQTASIFETIRSAVIRVFESLYRDDPRCSNYQLT